MLFLNKVIITTDSTCDLSKELIIENDIRIIPLYVNFGEESYKDGVDINTESLYQKVDECGYLPKTAATSVGDFIEFFRPLIDEGYDIFYCGISSLMSRTYQNALMAKEEFPEGRIEVIDAKNLSTGIGLLLLKAKRFASEGYNVHEIAKMVSDLVPKVRSQFFIETMDYLYKGGRCSGIAKFAATLLKMKPIIEVRDGKMEVGKKPIGSKRACDFLIDMIKSDYPNIDLDNVFITHAIAPESCKYLEEELPKAIDASKVRINVTQAGCVISSHCGRGTIGILYIKN